MNRIRATFDIQSKRRPISILLAALCSLDSWILKTQNCPALYQSGIRYKREDPNADSEDWWTIENLLKTGYGDCEDLACVRVAEYRNQGINAVPWLEKRGHLYHVVVKLPDGRIEDPSKILGMKDR